MKYDDFWKELQAVCPDVDVARAKKLCDGMVDVFADNYMQGRPEATRVSSGHCNRGCPYA